MSKKELLKTNYFNQDFVDFYEFLTAKEESIYQRIGKSSALVIDDDNKTVVSLVDQILATFSLSYSNTSFMPGPVLDYFYERQLPSGEIEPLYNRETGQAIRPPEGSDPLCPPLLAWAELNIYHKIGSSKRLGQILPNLVRYYEWLEKKGLDEDTQLYRVPLSACFPPRMGRERTAFPIDFNAQQALSALCIAQMGRLTNDKDIVFAFTKRYYSLKSAVQARMWSDKLGSYVDLDQEGQPIEQLTLAAYWTLLAEICEETQLSRFLRHISAGGGLADDLLLFPFDVSEMRDHLEALPSDHAVASFPLIFAICKGLEKYDGHELARTLAIRHFLLLISSFDLEDSDELILMDSYYPEQHLAENVQGTYFCKNALVGISLFLENILGFTISLPRKTVDWNIVNLEEMGIDDLLLLRNLISIQMCSSSRGWKIELHSEKLYYFTINLIKEIGMKKTLPIPSGKCVILLSKLWQEDDDEGIPGDAL